MSFFVSLFVFPTWPFSVFVATRDSIRLSFTAVSESVSRIITSFLTLYSEFLDNFVPSTTSFAYFIHSLRLNVWSFRLCSSPSLTRLYLRSFLVFAQSASIPVLSGLSIHSTLGLSTLISVINADSIRHPDTPLYFPQRTWHHKWVSFQYLPWRDTLVEQFFALTY